MFTSYEQLYNQDDLDDFFVELTNIFEYALKNGIAFISTFPFKIENQYVFSTLKMGLSCIENALHPTTVRTLLETSNLLVLKECEDAKPFFFQLKLLELIIPYIQLSEVCKFLRLSNQLCSMKKRGLLEAQLSKYITDYA